MTQINGNIWNSYNSNWIKSIKKTPLGWLHLCEFIIADIKIVPKKKPKKISKAFDKRK